MASNKPSVPVRTKGRDQPNPNPASSGESTTKEITLLLLGETGVGKSTWINGFANFLEYETLQEAEDNPTLCLIPACYAVNTVVNGNYESKMVCVGSDVNEVTAVGQSATQLPQTYTFYKDGTIIRLIDTPGIGDVRGPDQDQKNFELILNHISNLDDLHGICILLKPDNAKLNIMFRFCIKELLTHLHKDARHNIIFCFTNARSTLYSPGATFNGLKVLLGETENQDVHIELIPSTIYCMDNEAIKFLYGLKSGITYPPNEREIYNLSWNKSADEFKRLLDHVAAKRPHAIQETLSLNNARLTILALRSPMAEISRNIQLNISIGETKMEELTKVQTLSEELCQSLMINEVTVEMEMLDIPRTICTAPKCVEIVQVGPCAQTNYITHCHQNCSKGKKKSYQIGDIVGHPKLKKCSAFELSGRCKTCRCSWNVHMKSTYQTRLVAKKVMDMDKMDEINQKGTIAERIVSFLKSLTTRLEELRFEKHEITKANALFAHFLKTNAIAYYNNDMGEYLKHFIREEQNKRDYGGDPRVLQGLKDMLIDHEEEMQILQGALQDEASLGIRIVSPPDLEQCIDNLYQLKHYGQQLRELMAKSLQSTMSNYTEKCIEKVGNGTITIKTVKPIRKRKPLFSTPGKNKSKSPPNAATNPKRSNEKFQARIKAFEPSKPQQQNVKIPSVRPIQDQQNQDDKYSPVPFTRRKGNNNNEPKFQDLNDKSGGAVAYNYKADTSEDSGIKSIGSTSSAEGIPKTNGVQIIARKELTTKGIIGEGGFGIVSRGSWNGADCAVKKIRQIHNTKIVYEDIIREAKIHFSLKHPNIVPLYGISYENNDLWMVMQLVDGDNLYTLMLDSKTPARRKMPVVAKIKIAIQASSAISYLHDKGYLHNDIKHENMIMEHRTGNLFLCDFGITRYLGGMEGPNFSSKYTNSFGGTLPYIAPECFETNPENKQHIRPTFKSDVWAMGAVLTEIFREKQLFPTEQDIYKCKLLKDYSKVKAANKSLPSNIQPILRDALEQNPAKRPTAQEMNVFFRAL